MLKRYCDLKADNKTSIRRVGSFFAQINMKFVKIKRNRTDCIRIKEVYMKLVGKSVPKASDPGSIEAPDGGFALYHFSVANSFIDYID